jgi:hypothetical protein
MVVQRTSETDGSIKVAGKRELVTRVVESTVSHRQHHFLQQLQEHMAVLDKRSA